MLVQLIGNCNDSLKLPEAESAGETKEGGTVESIGNQDSPIEWNQQSDFSRMVDVMVFPFLLPKYRGRNKMQKFQIIMERATDSRETSSDIITSPLSDNRPTEKFIMLAETTN